MNFNQDSTSSPVRFTPRKEDGYKKPDDVNTRPSTNPQSSKDFKKVLSKTDEEDEGQNAKSQGVEDAAAESSSILGPIGKKKKMSSLFDLTSGFGGGDMDGDKKPVEKRLKNLFKDPNDALDLDSKGSNQLTAEELADEAKALDKSLKVSANAGTDSNEKSKFTTRFSTEQPDLSYINPMAAMAQANATVQSLDRPERVEPAVNLQAIIDQLVEKTVELKVNGATETTVTLKHPPLFAGANIIVTSFDNAKNEFNISFENLTQQAKNILDMQINRDSLLLALEKKGYAVHILSATTISEPRINIASAAEQEPPNRERRDREGGEGRQPGKRQGQ